MTGYHNSVNADLENLKTGEWKSGKYGMSLGTGMYFFTNIGNAKRSVMEQENAYHPRKFIYEVTLPDDGFLFADFQAYQDIGGKASREDFLFEQLDELNVKVDEPAFRRWVTRADNYFGVKNTPYTDAFTNIILTGKIDLSTLNGIISRKYTLTNTPPVIIGVYYRPHLLSGNDFLLIEGSTR